jgi:hypothetical protein
MGAWSATDSLCSYRFEPLGVVAQVVLEEICAIKKVLTKTSRLLEAVRAAYAALTMRLRLESTPRGIAVCQRGFFTHEAARPPSTPSPKRSLPFTERAYLLSAVA